MDKKAIIDAAFSLGAPLIETAVKKLNSELSGSSGASRTTDILIINTTETRFVLESASCGSGGWASNLLPPSQLLPKTSDVYRCESRGYLSGCTGCKVVYKSATNGWSKVTVSTSNPFVGSVYTEQWGSGFDVTCVLGVGNNNIVRFIIKDSSGIGCIVS
jgi:hypothetical protein